MYCRQCGAQNPDSNLSCNACGAPLSADTTAPVQTLDAQTSGLAIAALVLGIITICSLITALPAVILGIIALVKISKSRGQLKGNGMAIAGIVVPCVWMLFVLPLLMATLMPALANVKTLAQQKVCAANMLQIGLTMKLHADDQGKFPDPTTGAMHSHRTTTGTRQ